MIAKRLSRRERLIAGKRGNSLLEEIGWSRLLGFLTRSTCLAQHNIKLETWTGATTETMAKAGLGDIVPSTLVLDQAGEGITRIVGEAREDDIRGRIDWLLKGRPGQAPEITLNRR
jgi:hypothetical protein